MSCLAYDASTGLHKPILKSWTELEFRDNKQAVALSSASGTTVFNMWRKLWMNSYDIAGGSAIGTAHDVNVGYNMLASTKHM